MSTRRHLVNALPNVMWTGIFAAPVYVYCSRAVPGAVLVGFCLAGGLVLFLPARLLVPLQLSAGTDTYRRLRVPVLLQLTQDAAWLQRFAGSEGALFRGDHASLSRAVRDTWMRERFHAALLLFFTLCMAWALWRRQWVWSAAIAVSNVLYNLYPVWLQQYLRLRLERLRRRREERTLIQQLRGLHGRKGASKQPCDSPPCFL